MGLALRKRSLSAEVSVHFSLRAKTLCPRVSQGVGNFLLAGQLSGIIHLLSFPSFMKCARDHILGEFPMNV